MGDMSKCVHGDAVGFCDTCSPNWEMDLIKADAADKIYQRGYEKGIQFILQQPNTVTITAAEYAKLKEDAERFEFLMNEVSFSIDRNLSKCLVAFRYWGTKDEVIEAIDQARNQHDR